MTELKYKTLSELKSAINSGELVLTEQDSLTIDNDSTCLYVGQAYNEEEDDYSDGEIVFDGGNPQNLLKEALDLLGIPCNFA